MFNKQSNILLVDDSQTNTYMLKELLSTFGYNAHESFSGVEALEAIKKYEFDLILLDIIMPEQDGFDVCRTIKQMDKYKNIPIIFLTALTDLNSIEKGFDMGAVDFITKPFKPKEIIARIKTHLELNAYRLNLETLVRERTKTLQRTNIELEKEIERRKKVEDELKLHKEKLEVLVDIRTKELKESEESFRTIFQKNGSPILIIDPENYCIVNANQTALEFYGYDIDTFSNKTIFDINFLSKERIEFELNNVKTLKKNYFNFQHKIATGEIREVEVYSFPIYLRQKLHLISTIHDITEKKEMQNKILSTIIQTEEKVKQRFAKDLHDGLGPILSTIKLYLKTLENKIEEKKDKNIYSIVKKIEEIINEAINSTKEISNQLSPHILTNFGLITAIKSIIKKIEFSSNIKFMLTADVIERFDSNIETSVYRIILELINNSIKHAKPNNIKISILQLDNLLNVTYNDDGQGFEFNQLENNLGMGLQNIQNRVNLLHGNYELKTRANQGFYLFFSVPIK